MRLTELDPKLSENGILRFDCPKCRDHGIRVAVGPEQGPDVPGQRVWKMTGEFPETITLQPSIDVPGCWHGFITNGEVTGI